MRGMYVIVAVALGGAALVGSAVLLKLLRVFRPVRPSPTVATPGFARNFVDTPAEDWDAAVQMMRVAEREIQRSARGEEEWAWDESLARFLGSIGPVGDWSVKFEGMSFLTVAVWDPESEFRGVFRVSRNGEGMLLS